MFKILIICLAASFTTLDDSRETPKPVQLSPENIATQPSPITRMAPGLKGKILYSTNQDCSLRAWDIKKGKFIWEVPSDTMTAPFIGMGVSKKHLTFIQGAPAFSIYNIDDGSKAPRAVGLMPAGAMRTMVFDPKGKWIWISSSKGGAIRLIPGNANGYSTRTLPNHGTMCMALGPKAKLLALGGQDEVRVSSTPAVQRRTRQNSSRSLTSPFQPSRSTRKASCSQWRATAAPCTSSS